MALRPERTQTPNRNAELLADVLRRHQPRLIRQARLHAPSRADAEDALQDAAVAFLRNYVGPSGNDAFAWLMAQTKYNAWAIRRRTHRGQTPLPLSLAESAPDEDTPGPARRIERSEETAKITRLLSTLKPDERTALILIGVGFSYAEIASVRGWTRTKVNRCLSEGRAQMRRMMGEGETP